MSRRLFDRDPVTGLTRYFHPSEDGDSFTIETVMDVEPILESNKRLLFGESSKGRHWRGDMRRVASLPLHVYWDLKEKGILDDKKAFARWLNDPENMYFRVMGGRV